MSFLLGGEYASGSSSASDASDAEDERQHVENVGENDGEEGSGAEPEVTSLPAADSVLDSVTSASASFRAPRVNGATSARPVRAFDLLEEEEKLRQKQKESDQAPEPEQQPPPRKRPRVSPNDNGKKKPATASTKDQDKRGAKERVKNQRVRGQAGIGSDFRSWKSDAEMAMRQQFD